MIKTKRVSLQELSVLEKFWWCFYTQFQESGLCSYPISTLDLNWHYFRRLKCVLSHSLQKYVSMNKVFAVKVINAGDPLVKLHPILGGILTKNSLRWRTLIRCLCLTYQFFHWVPRKLSESTKVTKRACIRFQRGITL